MQRDRETGECVTERGEMMCNPLLALYIRYGIRGYLTDFHMCVQDVIRVQMQVIIPPKGRKTNRNVARANTRRFYLIVHEHVHHPFSTTIRHFWLQSEGLIPNAETLWYLDLDEQHSCSV